MTITPLKKHIVPAFINWMFENDPKVHVGFVVDHPDVILDPVPRESKFTSVQFRIGIRPVLGKVLTLSLHPEAIADYEVFDQGIRFRCRMDGEPMFVSIPFDSVVQITAPNVGLIQEMGFDLEFLIKEESTAPEREVKSRPKLTLIHSNP